MNRHPRVYVPDRPRPGEKWDTHPWEHGNCWLWCLREGVGVTWIGPVQSSGLYAPMFACRACIRILDDMVYLANLRKDGSTTPTGRPP